MYFRPRSAACNGPVTGLGDFKHTGKNILYPDLDGERLGHDSDTGDNSLHEKHS